MCLYSHWLIYLTSCGLCSIDINCCRYAFFLLPTHLFSFLSFPVHFVLLPCLSFLEPLLLAFFAMDYCLDQCLPLVHPMVFVLPSSLF